MVKTGILLAGLVTAVAIFGMFQNTLPSDIQPFSKDELKQLESFIKWAQEFSKSYSSPAEKIYRQKVFLKTLEEIKGHNADKKNTWSKGLTDFSDLTSEEFAAKHNLKSLTGDAHSHLPSMDKVAEEEPKSSGLGQGNIDWTSYLQSNYIYTTSNCNSAYAWVSTYAMNANYYIATGGSNVNPFSPQTYIDCSGNFRNNGCTGGFASNCYEYSKYYGIDTLANYPYVDYQNSACRAVTGYFKNRAYYNIPQYSNSQLASAVAQKQIVTAAIDIVSAQHYTGGVFSGPCSANPNHPVLIVGLGVDPASRKAYWLVMNTWGQNWGERGFIRVQRFTQDAPQFNSCGLNTMANYPLF